MFDRKALPPTEPPVSVVRFSTVQQQLLARANAALAMQFDCACNLLVHPAVDKFRSVFESLCYAALLLAEQSDASANDHSSIARANAIIDAVLATQVGEPSHKALGAFPLAWSPDGGAADLAEPDTRQTVGSMLGMLALRFPELVGEERLQQIGAALHRCCAGERAGRIEVARTHLQMMHAWLNLEHGGGAPGAQLASKVARQADGELRVSRFGSAAAVAQQLWSIGLWFHSSKLVSAAARLGNELWNDIVAWRHPDLSTLFGSGIRAEMREDRAAGQQRFDDAAWLGWLELTRGSDLHPDASPLAAALLALPVLAAQRNATAVRRQLDAQPAQRALTDTFADVRLSGWFEKDLHIETAQYPAERQGATLVAAYWPTRAGLATLRCRTSHGFAARCDKRFVRLHRPGNAEVHISGLGAGEARMIEGGWWLAGLHLGVEGFQISDARRSDEGLRLWLRPTADQPMLLLAPLGG